MSISLMRPEDLDEIVGLERFIAQGWERDRIVDAEMRPEKIAVVSRRPHGPLRRLVVDGWLLYEISPATIRIRRILVHPSVRFQGVGARLVRWPLSLLYSDGSRFLETTMTVREDRLDLLCFARRLGFRATALLKDHYGERDGIHLAFAREPAHAKEGERLEATG